MPYMLVNGTNNVQPMQGVAFGQPVNVNYYINKKSESDSYMGKTLLAAGSLTLGLIFHKNIANLFRKYTPGLCKFLNENIGSHVAKFMGNHKENWFVKNTLQGKAEFADIGDKIMRWLTKK